MSDRTVLASGVFDLFHVGHLRYLQHARRQGTRLVVGIVSDEDVLRIKGRVPSIPQAQRMEIVAALSCVDQARLQPTSTRDTDAAQAWIAAWGCRRVVVGGMWEGDAHWVRLAALLAPRGIDVMYAPSTEGISSTLIKSRLGTAPPGGAAC